MQKDKVNFKKRCGLCHTYFTPGTDLRIYCDDCRAKTQRVRR